VLERGLETIKGRLGSWMSALSSRSVLAVAVVGCVAALLVALIVEPVSHAAKAAASHSASVAGGCDISRALTKANELPGNHPGVHVFRHPCGGTVLQLSSAALRSQTQNADPGVATATPAHADGFVTVAHGDDEIAFSPLDARAAERRTHGSAASYADSFPGAELTYVPTGNGVKETIVLTDARTTRFAFRLRLSDGLTAIQRGHGIDVRRGGAVVASFAAPFMTDASPQHVSSDAVTLRLGHDAHGDTLTLTADPRWVRAHLAAGPVSIDPTVGFAPADPDCEIQSSAPTANICSATTLGVGVTTNAGVTRKRRALLRYTIDRWLPKGSQIYQATLFARVTSQPTTPLSVDVVSPTKAWTSGVTWNTYNGTNAWTTAGGDYTATPVATNTSVGDTNNVWESWGVTSAVQSWADTGNTNGGFGLMLKQSNEGSVQGDVTFASSENGSVPGDQLDIYYNNMSGAMPYYSFDAKRKLTDTLSMAVNVASGNLLLRNRDLHVKGTGLDLTLDRYYNSREAGHYSLGWGWTYDIDNSIKLAVFGNGNVQFTGPSDYTQLFTKTGPGTYAKPPGLEATLIYTSATDTFTMTWNTSGEKWTFNGSGTLTKMADRNGNQISVGYTGVGTLSQITDTQSRTVNFNTSTGPITSLTDSTSRVRSYAYNTVASGEAQPNTLMVSSTDPEGKITKYGYGGPGGSAITTITDPRNNVTTITYDTSRRVSDIAWAGGGHTTFAYGTATSACGGSDLNTVVTDPLGHATTYCWQVPGRVTKVVDAAGNNEATTYTGDSQVQTFTDAASKITTLGYDGLDNLSTASTPGGENLKWDYTDTANKYSVTKATNARGTASVATYDSSGNTTGVADGGTPAASTITLEHTGQTGGVCANPLGPNGTVRCSIDANGSRTSYGYDIKGNLTSITPPVPLAPTTITNDALSRVSTVIDGKGQKQTYTYDKLDRVKRIDYANSAGTTVTSTTFDYNANGSLLTRADITGSTTNTTSYSYDARNRKTQDTLPDTSTNSYTYDGADNLKTFTDPGGTVTYSYDSRNLPASLAEPGGSCSGTVSKCTTFAYDTRGRHTTTTYPNGVTQTWGWDDDNHLTSLVAKNSAGTVLRSFTYTYVDPANSKPTDLRFSVTDQAANKTTYGYDGLDRLTSAVTKTSNGAGTTTDNYTYAYDPAGNRTGQTAMANGGTSTTSSSIFNADNELCWTVTGGLPGGASCSLAADWRHQVQLRRQRQRDPAHRWQRHAVADLQRPRPERHDRRPGQRHQLDHLPRRRPGRARLSRHDHLPQQ
jgi:YD repeat-containing protein